MKYGICAALSCGVTALAMAVTCAGAQQTAIDLPTSKQLMPVPGTPQRTNSLPMAIAASPDGRYLALLNAGYGTYESKYQQSIAVLDTSYRQSDGLSGGAYRSRHAPNVVSGARFQRRWHTPLRIV